MSKVVSVPRIALALLYYIQDYGRSCTTGIERGHPPTPPPKISAAPKRIILTSCLVDHRAVLSIIKTFHITEIVSSLLYASCMQAVCIS